MSRWARGSDARTDRSPIARNGYDRRVLMVTCPTCGVSGQPCLRIRKGQPTNLVIPDAHPARYDEATRVY